MGKNYLLIIFLLVFLLSVAGMIISAGRDSLVSVAAAGGTLIEGVIGTPRFVNPLLAETNTDKDLVALSYSGLVRIDSSGVWQGDLAQSYTTSNDGLTYTFVLRDNLEWHDGEPISADDIIFTIERAKRPASKSPRRIDWDNIEIEKASEREVIFSLKQPSTDFLSLASLGILPKHLWSSVDDESFPYNPLNLKAVGSGPYQVAKIKTDSSNTPIEIEFASFKKFALGRPPIDRVVIKFYGGEDDLLAAYRAGKIESAGGLSPTAVNALAATGARVIDLPLPRVFGVFFNPNQNEFLLNKRVRQALALAVDKEAIVEKVLLGYGEVVNSPLANHFLTELALEAPASDIAATPLEIIEAAGLKPEEIKLTLSTSDTPELKHAAEMIRDDWRELGIMVDLKIFELGALNQNVIRPREYEALFFGEVIGRDLDLYPFWHSSQRLDPFLNVALYANISVDKALETIRNSADPEGRRAAYQTVIDEINEDLPAILIYSPKFLYVLPALVKTPDWSPPNTASDRFSTIHLWHLKTDRVWKIFAN